VNRLRVAVLGGSFDPVHKGHIALADHFIGLLHPDVLRVIPAGQPWQKPALQAPPEQRVAMLKLAFNQHSIPVDIDDQEIKRNAPSYTIDTLRALRAELGQQASILFLIGADQLQQLNTWHDWRGLFDYAHICAAARPASARDATIIPSDVAEEFKRRAATPEQLRNAPHGMSHFAPELAVDVSSTTIRSSLQRGERPESLLPIAVLDYIQQHHLYRS
jgi:nicotinate-nucleotide adenylyltransferase